MSDTNSINTFASFIDTISTCDSIENTLKQCNGNLKLQRKVSEIVLSLKNSIVKNGGKERSTEFFGAIISFLSLIEIDVDTMEASVFILRSLMKQDIPIAVIRHTTSRLSKIILDLFTKPYNKNENIVINGLFCLSKLISVQSDDSWEFEDIAHLYRTIFSFVTDSRENINKAARKNVLSIFYAKSKASGLLSKKHPLNKETINILTNSIKTQNNANKKNEHIDIKVKTSPEDDKLSFSLTMIGEILKSKLFNSECVVLYLEKLIQCLLSLQIVPIQCQILNILSNLFLKKVLFPEQIARCLTSLFTYLNLCSGKSNNKNSSTPIPSSFIGAEWLKTVSIGFESLLFNNEPTFIDSESKNTINCRIIALTHCTNLVKFCSDWLLCDNDQFKKTALWTLQKLCSGALTTNESTVDLYLDPMEFPDADNWLSKWAEILCKLLLVQSLEIWSMVLDNLTRLITRSKGKCEKFSKIILDCVPRICELRDSYEDTEAEVIASLTSDRLRNVKATLTEEEKTFKLSSETFLGNIIKCFGFSNLNKVMPLTEIFNSSSPMMDSLSNRTWIVPLIKAYTQETSLDQFRVLILPCIQLITKKIDSLTSDDQMEIDKAKSPFSVAVLSLGTLRYQLWSCLPSFANKVIPGGILEVSNNLIEPYQYPVDFPPGIDCPRITLWQLILDLLNPIESSNLEVIALTAIRNLVLTAKDEEEMKQVLTSNVLFPKVLSNMFSLYLKKDYGIQMNIKSTLSVYLKLFSPETFIPNCEFLITKKLADLNPIEPSENHLSCIELLIIIGPYLDLPTIARVTEFLSQYLNDRKVNNQIQKRVYRYFEIISASNTETSNEYTKNNIDQFIEKFKLWKNVKIDSWKCRMKTLYNLFKLMNTTQEKSGLLNGFLSEIIGCINVPNKKTRAISGLILVEGILSCCEETTGEEIGSIGNSIDRMLKLIISCLKEKIHDKSNEGINYKSALSKALFLILSESRLARSVTREHIDQTMTIIKDILSNHDNENNDRHLIYCAFDILSGLLKKKTHNFGNIYLLDVGQCLHAAEHKLRIKIRMPIKKILKKMLKLWPYEKIKSVIPEELIAVLRNIHKSMNRSQRSKNETVDNESFATSWGGFNDNSSQNTVKGPHFKNIAELLHDSDSEDEDLKTKMTTTTIANKSLKSSTNELRKAKKRKIKEANETLRLVENTDDIVDLSDQVKMVQNMRINDKTAETKKLKFNTEQTKVDKRGFEFQNGRLIIGQQAKEEDKRNKIDENSEEEDYQSKKERFQPPKKRVKKEKLPGFEYRSNKKGAFGDKMGKNKVQPFAYIPLKSTDQCHNIMTKYEREIKKAQGAARKMSKIRKQSKR